MGSKSGLDGFGEQKILWLLPAFKPRTVQLVASRSESGKFENQAEYLHWASRGVSGRC